MAHFAKGLPKWDLWLKEVIVVKKAPLQDPVEYNILGYNVTLRLSEAHLIEVDQLIHTDQESNFLGTLDEVSENTQYSGKGEINTM